MCVVLTTAPPGNLPQRLLLLKEYIYFLSCLLWHLFVYFTSCMFLCYFSLLWELSLTLVNRFSNNIGFLHTNTLHFKNVFSFWLHWVFIASGAFHHLWQARDTLYLQCTDFSFSCLLLLQCVGSMPLHSSCDSQTLEHGVVAYRFSWSQGMRELPRWGMEPLCINYQVDSLPLSQKGGPKACSLTCILEPMNWIS